MSECQCLCHELWPGGCGQKICTVCNGSEEVISKMLVDDREPQPNAKYPDRENIVEYLIQRDVPAKFERLDVGDYQWWDSDNMPVLISRKSSDLLPSIFDNHFQEELTACVNFCESAGGGHIWVVSEGPWTSGNGLVKHFKKQGTNWMKVNSEHYGSPRLIPGLYISLTLSGIGVLCTNSIAETADVLSVLYQRSQEGWPTEFLSGRRLPTLKRTTNTKVAKLMMLCPRLPEKVAIALLKEFGSIGSLIWSLEHEPDQLTKIKGFGKILLERLEESLD